MASGVNLWERNTEIKAGTSHEHAFDLLLDALLKLAEEGLIVLLSGSKGPVYNELPVGLPEHFPIVHNMVSMLPSFPICSR